jgi:hypothetical protein
MELMQTHRYLALVLGKKDDSNMGELCNAEEKFVRISENRLAEEQAWHR